MMTIFCFELCEIICSDKYKIMLLQIIRNEKNLLFTQVLLNFPKLD